MLVLRRRRSGTRLYQLYFVLKYQFLFLSVRDGERISLRFLLFGMKSFLEFRMFSLKRLKLRAFAHIKKPL